MSAPKLTAALLMSLSAACAAPTQSDEGQLLSTKSQALVGAVAGSSARSLADVDGDGDDDLLWRHGTEIRVALSTRAGFAAAKVWTTWNVHADYQLADVDGNGKVDLVGRKTGSSVIEVALSTGTRFNSSTPWTSWNRNASYSLAKVDADNKADLVGRVQGTSEIHVALSTGSAFRPSTVWASWHPTAEYVLATVNGDTMADLVGRRPGSPDLHVAISTGSSFAPSTAWTTWSPNADFRLADVSGDGRADVVGRIPGAASIQVALSSGSRFEPSTKWTSWSPQAEYLLGNVTGEGGADLVARTPQDIQVARSTGTSFQTSTAWLSDPVAVTSYTAAISSAALQDHIEAICVNGRRMPEPGAPWANLKAAADYISGQFSALGYPVSREPVFLNGEWVGDNIIATKTGIEDPSRYIEITGHYDGGADAPGAGAKDNATGTATVIEIARVLAAYPSRHSFRFIAFAAEELVVDAPGSMTHVENSLRAGETIVANLNADTTGTGNAVAGLDTKPSTYMTVWYRGAAAYQLTGILSLATTYAGLPLQIYPEDIGVECQSDERSYAVHDLLGISSLGDWRNSLFHQEDDVPENVNIDNVRWSAQANVALGLFLDHSRAF